MCVVVGDALVFWLILLNWIESSQIKKLNQFLNFQEKRLLNHFLNWISLKKIIMKNPLNWILSWNEWLNHILNLYLPFSCLFWTPFGHFSYSTSINDSKTIELNYILNWISRIFFELNNLLNWILGKAILKRILNESFFGKIQTLNWIRLGIGHH